MNTFFPIAMIGLVSYLFAACGQSVKPPPRAAGIPSNAVWAGGVDRGSWILCEFQEQSGDRYRCKIFNDYSGTTEASGEYIIRHSTWDKDQKKAIYSPVAQRPHILRYRSFDGVTIRLDDSMELLPDGWIDHPFGDGHGKKHLYDIGRKVGSTVSY